MLFLGAINGEETRVSTNALGRSRCSWGRLCACSSPISLSGEPNEDCIYPAQHSWSSCWLRIQKQNLKHFVSGGGVYNFWKPKVLAKHGMCLGHTTSDLLLPWIVHPRHSDSLCSWAWDLSALTRKITASVYKVLELRTSLLLNWVKNMDEIKSRPSQKEKVKTFLFSEPAVALWKMLL